MPRSAALIEEDDEQRQLTTSAIFSFGYHPSLKQDALNKNISRSKGCRQTLSAAVGPISRNDQILCK